MRKPNPMIFPLLLICAEMLAYLSNDMYLPALPVLMRDFGVGADQIQLSLSAWFLGSMSMQLVVGPLSDRIGRRPVLICGMVLFVLSTLLCILAPQFEYLILARFVQGSTVCFIVVAGYASIHELFDQKNAIHLLARMSSVVVLAPALGPLIGGFILSGASWQWTFWPLFILGLVILILLVKWMPEPLSPNRRHPLKISLLAKQYRALLCNSRFLLLLLTNSFIFCGFIAWLCAGPFFVIQQFHYPPFVFGLLQMLIFSFFILSTHLVKRFMDRLGIPGLIIRGLGITLVGGVLATLTAFLLPDYLSGLILGMVFYAFGFGLCTAPLQRLAIEASTIPMGLRMALLSTSLGFFGFLATTLVQLSYNGKLSSLAIILLVTTIVAILTFLLRQAEPKVNLTPLN